MVAPSSVRRTKVDVSANDEGYDPDDDPTADSNRIRVYFSPELGQPPMPSVSVIKNLRVDPEKTESLQGWQDRYDGQSEWARPWWKDQMTFKGHRGTLVHFAILSELGPAGGDTYFHRVGTRDWGHEEYYSEYCLKKWSTKAPSANSTAVPYVPRDNTYDGEHAWDKAVRGMKWAARAFHEHMIANGRLDPDNVQSVEEYVFDTEYGYGGQYDLLYDFEIAGDTRTVLADVKTSSGIRFGNKLQLAAYKHAVESNPDHPVDRIDECEIIRLHPDSETVEVSRSPEWTRSLRGLEHEFLALCDRALREVYPETLLNAEMELMDTTDEQATLDDTGVAVQPQADTPTG